MWDCAGRCDGIWLCVVMGGGKVCGSVTAVAGDCCVCRLQEARDLTPCVCLLTSLPRRAPGTQSCHHAPENQEANAPLMVLMLGSVGGVVVIWGGPDRIFLLCFEGQRDPWGWSGATPSVYSRCSGWRSTKLLGRGWESGCGHPALSPGRYSGAADKPRPPGCLPGL